MVEASPRGRCLALLLFAQVLTFQAAAQTVSITAPADQASFTAGSRITITANATSAQGTIAQVQFFANGQLIGVSSQPSALGDYSYVWLGAAAGTYTLTAVATDNVGQTSISSPITLFLNVAGLETFSGELQVFAVDHFSQKTSSQLYGLKTQTQIYQLNFQDPNDVEGISPGSQVSVDGIASGNDLLVPAGTANSVAPIVSEGKSPSLPRIPHIRVIQATQKLAAVKGVYKVAVFLVTYQADRTRSNDPAVMKSFLATTVDFYKENSYGQVQMSADIFGYFDLTTNPRCFNLVDLQNTVQALASQNGIDLTQYNSAILSGPPYQCGTGEGFANIKGDATYGTNGNTQFVGINGITGSSILSHEIGHNFGLYHAKAQNCGNAYWSPTTACIAQEYGDEYDNMGLDPETLTPLHFNSVRKDTLGWLNPFNVTANGAFRITPLELADTSTKSLKITPPQSTESFYLEYRRPIGFDSKFSNLPGIVGPQVRLSKETPNIFSYVLSANPQGEAPTTFLIDPSIHNGQTYFDYAKRFSITTISADANSAVVRILIPGVNSPTLMFISPVDKSSVSGPVAVAVDALDRTGVTKVELSLDGTLINTMTAAPYTYTWNSAAVAPGVHQITAKAYNAAGNTFSQSLSVTVAAIPPTVSITSPPPNFAYPLTGIPLLKTTVQAGSLPVSKVEFFANGASLGLGASSEGQNYVLPWTGAVAGKYSLTAKATDSGGNTATSAAVAVTLGNFTAPVIAISQPVNSASLPAPANLPVRASVSDPSGIVGAIQVTIHYTLASSGVSGDVRGCTAAAGANCAFSLVSLPAGTYAFSAQVFDAQGYVLATSGASVAVRVF